MSSLFISKTPNHDPDDEKIKVDVTSEDFQQLYELGKGEEFRIKTINYVVEEYMTTDFVLQRQQFTEDDGAYFPGSSPILVVSPEIEGITSRHPPNWQLIL